MTKNIEPFVELTVDEYLIMLEQTKPSRSKYNNVKVKEDGYIFDSKAEYRRYLELKELQGQGMISKLDVHPKFILQPAFVDNQGRKQSAITYSADFSYTENNREIVEDVKGGRVTQTALFRIKQKMFLRKFPQYIFRIIER